MSKIALLIILTLSISSLSQKLQAPKKAFNIPHLLSIGLTADDYIKLFQNCRKLKKFVFKWVMKKKFPAIKLPKFDFIHLVQGKGSWAWEKTIKMILNRPQEAQTNQGRRDIMDTMSLYLKHDEWRVLFHWILEYEFSLLNLTEPPPEPQPESIIRNMPYVNSDKYQNDVSKFFRYYPLPDWYQEKILDSRYPEKWANAKKRRSKSDANKKRSISE